MEEPKEIPAYCTIDEITAECMSDLGDSADMGQFMRYSQWVIRGYGQLRKFALPVGKEQLCPINLQTSTVTLPDECVDVADVGINAGGQWWSFTEKPELVSSTTEDCGEEILDTTKGEGGILFENNPIGYAVSGGRNAYYYKKNLRNHRIIVHAPGLTEVILKYVSTGISVNGDTLIPLIAKEALIAWTHWQRELNTKSSDKYEKEKREQIWRSRLRELRRPSNLNSLYDFLYSTIKNSPKR